VTAIVVTALVVAVLALCALAWFLVRFAAVLLNLAHFNEQVESASERNEARVQNRLRLVNTVKLGTNEVPLWRPPTPKDETLDEPPPIEAAAMLRRMEQEMRGVEPGFEGSAYDQYKVTEEELEEV
jgi:hypothetical protein